MICSSCKEEVSSKSKHALSQNICPICGGAIFSNADLFFRKSIGEILKKHEVIDETKILSITNDIGDVLDGPEPEDLPKVENSAEDAIVHGTREPGAKREPRRIGRVGTVAGADQGTAPNIAPSGEITLDDINAADGEDSAPVSAEEKAEVDAMIAKGEIVFSNTMIKEDKVIPASIKKVAQPITRI